MSNLATLLYSFPLGLSAALCTLISNAVGENDYIKAKNYFKISYFSSFGYAVVGTILFFGYKRELGEIFTQDELILENFLSIMSIF